MPRQFFITDLVCTVDPGGSRMCRPDVGDIRVNYTAACQDWDAVANPQCMVLLAGDTTSANSKGNIVALVAENFDTPIASLPANVRNRINNGMTNKTIPLNVNDFTLVRDFLTALGTWFDPNFTLENFWVSD
jgi:hypothetical protein